MRFPGKRMSWLGTGRCLGLGLVIALGFHAPAQATELADAFRKNQPQKKAAGVSPRRFDFDCCRNQAALAYCALAWRAAAISSGP